jgi:hypothetical protein
LLPLAILLFFVAIFCIFYGAKQLSEKSAQQTREDGVYLKASRRDFNAPRPPKKSMGATMYYLAGGFAILIISLGLALASRAM